VKVAAAVSNRAPLKLFGSGCAKTIRTFMGLAFQERTCALMDRCPRIGGGCGKVKVKTGYMRQDGAPRMQMKMIPY
jgi:hypothetical protein